MLKGRMNYPLPVEGKTLKETTMLKMSLHPGGGFESVDPFEFNGMSDAVCDDLVRMRLQNLQKRNINKGLKGEFEPTFSLVPLSNPCS